MSDIEDKKIKAIEDFLRVSEMRKHGELARPRLLLHGYPQELADAVSDVFPTTREVEYLAEVDLAEYDALVAYGQDSSPPHLFSLSTHGGVVPNMELPFSPPGVYFNSHSTTQSKILYVPPELPEPLIEIIEQRLIPLLRDRQSNPYLTWDTSYNPFDPKWKQLPAIRDVEAIHPFVRTKNGEILAAAIEKRGGLADAWIVPIDYLDEIEAWLRAAIPLWRQRSPQRFPWKEDWAANPVWQTPQEEAIHRDLQTLRSERLEAEAKFIAAEEALVQKGATAAAEASTGIRSLLLDKGEPLATTVENCLVEMGFKVTNMDAIQPEHDKVEDLRVLDGEWVALCEVKGHKSGAKSNDLLLFAKWIGRYATEHQRTPDACWYVVNQFRGQDPSERPLALESKQIELDTWSQSTDGMVIDTAQLFLLWKDVVNDKLTREQARKLLKDSRGRFVYQPV
jgi:hypothetical protein